MRCDSARRELDECLRASDWSAELRAHVTGCKACRPYADRLVRLEAALRAAARPAPMADEGAAVAQVLAAWHRRRTRRRTVRWCLAAAAAVILLAVTALLHLGSRPAPPENSFDASPRISITVIGSPSGTAPERSGRISGIVGFVGEPVRRPTEMELAELAGLPDLL